MSLNNRALRLLTLPFASSPFSGRGVAPKHARLATVSANAEERDVSLSSTRVKEEMAGLTAVGGWAGEVFMRFYDSSVELFLYDGRAAWVSRRRLIDGTVGGESSTCGGGETHFVHGGKVEGMNGRGRYENRGFGVSVQDVLAVC